MKIKKIKSALCKSGSSSLNICRLLPFLPEGIRGADFRLLRLELLIGDSAGAKINNILRLKL